MQRREFTFDRVVRILITVAIIAGAVWLINVLRNVLLPFLVAWLVAYMLEPFVQFNRRLLHLRGRVLAVFISLFEVVTLAGIAIWFVGPIIGNEMSEMASILNRYARTELQNTVIPQEVHSFIRRNLDFDSLSRLLTRQEWTSLLQKTLQGVWKVLSGGFSIVMALFNWLIVVLYVVFIMIDYDKLSRGMRRMVPPSARPVVYALLNDIKTSMNHYFRGQATIALIVGVLFSIGFLIIGMPMAIVFGLFIGVLNLVPYLQLVSIVPALLLCVIYSAGGSGDFLDIAMKCVAVYAVVQVIQDFFLTPKIMGKSMGLNPALILLSLSVWGTLLGFVGLIIALPLTTLILSYYEHFIADKEAAEAAEEITE